MDRFDMDFENRIVTPEYTGADAETEFSLRPRTLAEYIGQDKAKENLSIYIEAAKMRGENARPCAALRPSRTGQDHPFRHHRQRDEGAISASPPARPSKNRAIWRLCLPI